MSWEVARLSRLSLLSAMRSDSTGQLVNAKGLTSVVGDSTGVRHSYFSMLPGRGERSAGAAGGPLST